VHCENLYQISETRAAAGEPVTCSLTYPPFYTPGQAARLRGVPIISTGVPVHSHLAACHYWQESTTFSSTAGHVVRLHGLALPRPAHCGGPLPVAPAVALSGRPVTQ